MPVIADPTVSPTKCPIVTPRSFPRIKTPRSHRARDLQCIALRHCQPTLYKYQQVFVSTGARRLLCTPVVLSLGGGGGVIP